MIAAELDKFGPPGSSPPLYIPTNPDCRVLAHIPSSGTPMQSAAKVRKRAYAHAARTMRCLGMCTYCQTCAGAGAVRQPHVG